MTEKKNKNELITKLTQMQQREVEIRQAAAENPAMEIGAAYKKWKKLRGESAERLVTAEQGSLKKEIRDLITRLQERPCTREGCAGVQVLEAICTGCIEGQAGYKTKWTCRTCLHRDLSKKEYLEWLKELSSSEKA